MRLSGFAFLPAAALAASTVMPTASAAPAWPNDFNGDGYADLTASDPADDGCSLSNGTASVLHGGADGITGDSVERLISCGFQASFGDALTAGDFNGDGYGDLAVSATGDGHSQVVMVYHGSHDGLVEAGAIDKYEVMGDQPGRVNAGFGRALSVGDFDGDSFSDLAIGAPGTRVGKDDDAGAVGIVPGSSSGLRVGRSQLITQDSRGVTGGAEPGDQFGLTLEARGDYNGDDRADLAVGVTENVRGRTGAGAVQVFTSRAKGLAGGITPNRLWHQAIGGVRGRAETDDHFGYSLVAGRFDGSGPDDLAVGSPDEGVAGVQRAGAITVLPGSEAGLTAEGSTSSTQATGAVAGDVGADHRFGTALAAADFGRTAADDLAVGIGSITSRWVHGGVAVLYGSDDGLTGTASQLWRPTNPDLPGDHRADDDGFGATLAASDYGRSAHADLAIGLFREDPSGAVNVLYGSDRGLTTTGAQLWTPDMPGLDGEPIKSLLFGYALL